MEPLNKQQLGIEAVYKEAILDLYKNPLHKGPIKEATAIHRELNPLCGDDITLEVKVENKKIIEAGHFGEGCAISQAAVSLLLDKVIGKSIEDVKKITKEEALELLGIPISHTRLKCALLGFKALQEVIVKK